MTFKLKILSFSYTRQISSWDLCVARCLQVILYCALYLLEGRYQVKCSCTIKNIEMKISADSSGIKQERTGDLPPSYVGTHCHEPQACVLTSMLSCSVVSDSLWSHGLQPARLLCPWDSPGKILEWIAKPSSWGSSQPREDQVSCISDWFFTVWATRESLF